MIGGARRSLPLGRPQRGLRNVCLNEFLHAAEHAARRWLFNGIHGGAKSLHASAATDPAIGNPEPVGGDIVIRQASAT